MRKSLAMICALMICFLCIAGCAPKNNTDPTNTQAQTQATTADEATTAQNTTVPATTVTTAPTTIAPEDDVVYSPISYNKVSSDKTQSTNKRPAGTGDEANRPSVDTSDKRYKYVAFTFDDGPHYDLTFKFVDKLAEYGGVGTFFVVGNRVSGTQQRAVKYAYDMGNEIGVHAWTHSYYYNTCSESRFRSELDKTADKILSVTGEYPLTMRPVGGGITSSRVKSSGFAVINWNVDSNDWRYTGRSQSNVNTIVRNVLNSTDEGDIILMHEIYYNSYDAFCIIIDELYDRGYRFVTVSDLLGLDSGDKGKLYYSAY
ncbi:MAG: polysaccharide deacetylase family protein [Clostridia bacterium]|nr:polysaccharide deacetylase family protein [Clostridia bacterium]